MFRYIHTHLDTFGVWCLVYTTLLFDTFGYHISFTITTCVLPDLHFSRPNVELVASLWRALRVKEATRQHVGGANSGMHAPARRTTTMEVIGQLPLVLWKWKCERRETRVKKEYIMMSGCIWHNQSSHEWVCWEHSYFTREKTHLTILV